MQLQEHHIEYLKVTLAYRKKKRLWSCCSTVLSEQLPQLPFLCHTYYWGCNITILNNIMQEKLHSYLDGSKILAWIRKKIYLTVPWRTDWLCFLASDTPSPPSRSERVWFFLRFEGLDDADGNVVPAELLWRLGSSGSTFEAAAANPSCDIVVPQPRQHN